MKGFVWGVWLAGFTSLRGQAGSRPGGRVTFFWLCQKKVSKERLFLGVGWADCVFLRWLAGFRPGSRVTFFWLCRKKVSKEGLLLRCLVGCCYCAPVASRVSARQPSYFFLLRQKKVTKKKASHVRALRVPCATRSVRDTCKLASLKQCKCLDPNAAPLLSTA